MNYKHLLLRESKLYPVDIEFEYRAPYVNDEGEPEVEELVITKSSYMGESFPLTEHETLILKTQIMSKIKHIV
jgi:hypothetical protein